MGSAQISQGQSAYHVHPNGLLDKLVMQRRGEGNGDGDVAWRNFLMRGHAIRNQATPLRQDLVSQHMFKSSWRCVSHQSTFGRPVSPAAFITCVQPLWRSSRSTDSRSWRRELAHLEELSLETTAKGTETCAFFPNVCIEFQETPMKSPSESANCQSFHQSNQSSVTIIWRSLSYPACTLNHLNFHIFATCHHPGKWKHLSKICLPTNKWRASIWRAFPDSPRCGKPSNIPIFNASLVEPLAVAHLSRDSLGPWDSLLAKHQELHLFGLDRYRYQMSPVGVFRRFIWLVVPANEMRCVALTTWLFHKKYASTDPSPIYLK